MVMIPTSGGHIDSTVVWKTIGREASSSCGSEVSVAGDARRHSAAVGNSLCWHCFYNVCHPSVLWSPASSAVVS